MASVAADPMTVAQITAQASTVVALISAGAAIVCALIAVFSAQLGAKSLRAIERERRDHQDRKDVRDREEQLSRYSEPLARAAYDLQSRIYNILNKSALGYFSRGDKRELEYIINNTTFLIAQYFAWTEIVRLDTQLIDLDKNISGLTFYQTQDKISGLWGTDVDPPSLRIFAGEQRALGEALIYEAPGRSCIGYGKFLATFISGRDPLFDAVRQDIIAVSNDLGLATKRLRKVQHGLIDLLDLLDAENKRFPADKRTKV